jgi:hypothetical protein
MSDAVPTYEDALAKALFVPCESKQDLHDWIHVYLGLDFPDQIVSEDSTSSPMDSIWTVYDTFRTRKFNLPDKQNYADIREIMAYSSRDSFKTLGASVLEVVVLLHLGLSVAHMAAIEKQAKKAQQYVKEMFDKPFLRDYVTVKNETRTEVTRYINRVTGIVITDGQFNKLTAPEQKEYDRHWNYITIIICSMAGANSEHVPFMCVAGDSKILIRSSPGSKRDRVARTARGIFNRLEGVSAGGRPAAQDETDISHPAETIEALTMNLGTGQFEFKPIVSACKQLKPVVKVTTADGKDLTCTTDHPLYVLGRGFVQVGDIKIGDRVLNIGKAKSDGVDLDTYANIRPEYQPTESPCAHADDPWEQVVLGSLLGDAGIYKKPSNNPYMQEQHCLEQGQYLEWKESILRNKIRTVPLSSPRSGYTGELQVGYRTGCSPLFLPFNEFRETFAGLEKLGPLGLAVWYQDDGCAGNGFRISSESFTKEQNETLAGFLSRRFGLEVDVRTYEREGRPTTISVDLFPQNAASLKSVLRMSIRLWRTSLT